MHQTGAIPLFILSLSLVFSAGAWAQSTVKQRTQNIRALVRQGPSSIPQLAGYLSDPEVEVRREATRGIVTLGTKESLDPLLQAAADTDSEVQMLATDGLVNFYYPGWVRKGRTASLRRIGRNIKDRLFESDTEIVPYGMEVRPDIIAALAKLVAAGADMEARTAAARGLGVLRGRAALPQLLEALKSKDTGLIHASLVAIQKIRDPEAASGTMFLLLDPNERVQIAAIETTGILRNKEALPRLREAFERARNAKVQRAALSAIAMIPDPASRPLYEAQLSSRDDGLRAGAAEGLARLKDPADRERVRAAFESERSASARLAFAFAAVSLGQLELSEFSPLQYLVNRLNSRAYVGVASGYLTELCRENAVRETLYPVLSRWNAVEKGEMADILAASGAADALPVLETLSRDPDPGVGQRAAQALRALRAKQP